MPRVIPRPFQRGTSALATLALVAGLAALTSSPVAAAPAAPADASVSLSGLTTNGRVDPLGIPGDDPSFGWAAASDARGVVQSAYQVRVASSEDALADPDVWDSGKVTSDAPGRRRLRRPGPGLADPLRVAGPHLGRHRHGVGLERARLLRDRHPDRRRVAGRLDRQVHRRARSTPGTTTPPTSTSTSPTWPSASSSAPPPPRTPYMWQISIADGTPEVPSAQARQRRLRPPGQQGHPGHHRRPSCSRHPPPVGHGRRQHHHHPARRRPDRPAHGHLLHQGLRRLPPGLRRGGQRQRVGRHQGRHGHPQERRRAARHRLHGRQPVQRRHPDRRRPPRRRPQGRPLPLEGRQQAAPAHVVHDRAGQDGRVGAGLRLGPGRLRDAAQRRAGRRPVPGARAGPTTASASSTRPTT